MNELYGLLGKKLSHSYSPIIHKVIFDMMGNTAHYHLFEIEEQRLEDAVKGLKALGAVGINVTIPYKVSVMRFLDKISPEAGKIGAVNCISYRNSETIGYNTDYFGFGMLLDKYDITVKSKSAVILGSGGSAITVMRYLLDHGIQNIDIVSRNPEMIISNKSDYIYDKFRYIDYSSLNSIQQGDIIINCTPCGMFPYVKESLVSTDVLERFDTAVDLIYNPRETEFLRTAKLAGLKTANGLFMLVSQAVAAHKLWNGFEASPSNIEDIYNIISVYVEKSIDS